jgi:hypothetical protein
MRKRLKDVNDDWWYRFGLLGIVITISMMTCLSCKRGKTIEYRWRIHGHVRMSTDPRDTTTHPAIWLTDTFEMHNDTVVITNSDSSQWRIAPPYKMTRIK